MNINQMNQQELVEFMLSLNEETKTELFSQAAALRERHYGNAVYTRGLIEFTNYCKNNCYYCGIRRDNKTVDRYRLTKEDILECCKVGYGLGYRTYVLQGGEDPYFTDEVMADIVSSIRTAYPDCAITLSMGERSYESYKRLFEAGANRYLLRHETADETHYAKLHPKEMQLSNRKQCLYSLKEIGYQVGAGLMVGSPFQTLDTIAQDILFLKELQPAMVGIGPFIPQKDTPFGEKAAGTVDQTLILVAMTRLLLPTALIPATTAVGTLDPLGREKALKAGANVVMPNLSPLNVRKKYLLYDNKICTGEEAAECKSCLERRIQNAGFVMDYSRGDHIEFTK